MMSVSRMVVIVALVLNGCGGLHEMTEGPDAASFHPATIAVLPPVAGEYESAREDSVDVLVSALSELKQFESIISPEIVADVFQGQPETFDALVAFNSKLEHTGRPDTAAALVIGKALNADALLVVRVNAWEYSRAAGDSTAKIGLGLRLVDPATGRVVWKAKHERIKSYTFMRPKLKDVALDLAEQMIEHLPR